MLDSRNSGLTSLKHAETDSLPSSRPGSLCGSDVHVWTVEMEASRLRLEQLFFTLSSDERKRADRFTVASAATAFIISRGILRSLTGAYLGLPPHKVDLYTGANGKPCVKSKDNLLSFNMAHSGNLAAYALSLGCELGIDIEQIADFPDIEAVSKLFFCAEEWAELAMLEGRQRTRSFFACWTRKEAYLKAKGTGLLVPLDSFRVSVRPEDAPRLIHIGGDISEAARWSVYHLSPHHTHVGALAFREKRKVHLFSSRTVEQVMTYCDDSKQGSTY